MPKVERPIAELLVEKSQQEAQLFQLLKQLTLGCGKNACNNKEQCASSNAGLKS